MSQTLKPKKDLKNFGRQDWLRPWKEDRQITAVIGVFQGHLVKILYAM
jgi:hypothetical protein